MIFHFPFSIFHFESGKTLRTVFLGITLCLLTCPALQAQSTSSYEKQFAAGVQALKAGQLDEAEKTFLQLLRQGGNASFVHHNLGIVHQQRDEHEKAVAQFRATVRLQPKFGEANMLMGYSLLALGKKAEAVSALEKAVTLLPNQPQARLQLARAYELQGNWFGVAEHYRALRAMNPQEAEYAYQLGRAYTRLAGWSYQRIAAIDPDAARLHQALGQDYLLQENYDLALQSFQQAAAADPRLPEIHLALALIYLELKNIEAAAREIEVELKLAPESQKALAVRQKIIAAREGKQ